MRLDSGILGYPGLGRVLGDDRVPGLMSPCQVERSG